MVWAQHICDADSQAKRIRANSTPIRTCPLASPSTQFVTHEYHDIRWESSEQHTHRRTHGITESWEEDGFAALDELLEFRLDSNSSNPQLRQTDIV